MNNALTLKSQRNYGVDFLRCFAMFLIVVLHILNQGYFSSNTHGTVFYISYFFEALAYPAVNIFAIVTGYVYVGRKIKPDRIFYLWLTVFFYSVIISIILKYFYSDQISTKEFVYSFLPVTSQRYWYFTAYFGLFFLIPFMNKVIEHLSKKQFAGILVTLISLFSIMSIYFDTFSTDFGYSILWLAVMYFVGAYIKKYNVGKKYKNIYNLIAFFLLSLLTLLSKCIIKFIKLFIVLRELDEDMFYKYTSPIIVLSAIFITVFFINANFQNKIFISIIKLLSPMAFSVYIIHTNQFVFNIILKKRFVNAAEYSPLKFLAVLVGASLLVYLGCSIIDYFRILLFKLLRVNKLALFAEKKLKKVYDKAVLCVASFGNKEDCDGKNKKVEDKEKINQ